MVPTVFTQTESKSYGNKPSPESSSADENKHYSQVTISQKLLTAYKETKKISATIKPLFILSHKCYFFIAKEIIIKYLKRMASAQTDLNKHTVK